MLNSKTTEVTIVNLWKQIFGKQGNDENKALMFHNEWMYTEEILPCKNAVGFLKCHPHRTYLQLDVSMPEISIKLIYYYMLSEDIYWW